jgi:hypothetical protein
MVVASVCRVVQRAHAGWSEEKDRLVHELREARRGLDAERARVDACSDASSSLREARATIERLQIEHARDIERLAAREAAPAPAPAGSGFDSYLVSAAMDEGSAFSTYLGHRSAHHQGQGPAPSKPPSQLPRLPPAPRARAELLVPTSQSSVDAMANALQNRWKDYVKDSGRPSQKHAAAMEAHRLAAALTDGGGGGGGGGGEGGGGGGGGTVLPPVPSAQRKASARGRAAMPIKVRA